MCDLHVAFAANDPLAVEAFMTRSDESTVTRHRLNPDPSWSATMDERASVTMRAILGRGKYYHAFQHLVEDIHPHIIWYFEMQSLRRTALLNPRMTVLDYCDVRWWKQKRLAQQESGKARIMGLLKSSILRLDDVRMALRVRHTVVASPVEVDLLQPAQNVSVLPNGFDFPARMPDLSQNSKRLLFYGSLFYRPNADGVRWMCQEIWPLIKAQVPDAQLDVVGLGNECLIDVTETPGVTFHGFVEDLDSLIKQSAALVVPLRVAGGTRIKILEAWAKGLPVVATKIGAEGLETQDWETALLVDSSEAFAEKCIILLSNAEVRKHLAITGYAHGRSRYDWKAVKPAIESILVKVLSGE